MVRAYIETEVDVELDNFAEEDLIEHIESLGYTVLENDDVKTERSIEKLYYEWLQMSPESFQKELKKFFSEALDIVIL